MQNDELAKAYRVLFDNETLERMRKTNETFREAERVERELAQEKADLIAQRGTFTDWVSDEIPVRTVDMSKPRWSYDV